MLIYDLALVEDRGAYYQVFGLTKNTFDNLADREEKYLKLSSSAYKMIKQAIAAGDIVRLPKTLMVDEVLPGEVSIISSTASPVEAARTASLVKVRSLVTPELTKISGYTMYSFTVLNNDLISEGYVITNKNREAKYIEIIETGNADLIAKLEQYLEARDAIDYAYNLKARLDAYVKQVDQLASIEEIAAAEEQFLTAFYAND